MTWLDAFAWALPLLAISTLALLAFAPDNTAQASNRLRVYDEDVSAGTTYQYRILVLLEDGRSLPSETLELSLPAAE